MAEQIVKRLVDDLDGGEAVETVPFSVDGVSYEIDLSGTNAAKLRESLSPFVQHARRASLGKRRRSRVASSRERSADIRAWAKAHGKNVSERGRIPANIVEEYERAH